MGGRVGGEGWWGGGLVGVRVDVNEELELLWKCKKKSVGGSGLAEDGGRGVG